MEKKLEVKNLKISFRTQSGKVQAVRDISFDLNKGETLAIVGESGSGKSVTSKAIIGILAGNSIVEGGEILYDGQDLLKISEDDFHKLRGDKIAMIFQDPMSSLNPIMRVGKQLTEAMVLKSKSSQRNARSNFNYKLKHLNEFMDKVSAEEAEQNKEMCQTFDNFCIQSTKLENAYNVADEASVGIQLDIDNAIFMIEKQQKFDYIKAFKKIQKSFPKAVHTYVLTQDEFNELQTEVGNFLLLPKEEQSSEKALELFKKIKPTIDASILKSKPNMFRLGYYMYKNPEADLTSIDIESLDEMTRKYLDENFMLEFLKRSSKAIEFCYEESIVNKRNTLAKAKEVLAYLSNETITKKESFDNAKELSKLVQISIDKLAIVKKSTEYSFKLAIMSELNKYFYGQVRNPKEVAKYERRKRKYDRLIEKGKTPTWKLVPAAVIDLDKVKSTIVTLVTRLIDSLEADIQEFDDKKYRLSENKAIDLVDYLKEQASRVVYKVTRRIAKAKALKLLEEVGIPEPQIRYRQYPFEFSGGMRQRIVIAIALSANPDILICDEPTTALDVTIQSQILELINKIKEERNLSVIFITHDLGVVANMADRIAVMYAGKIVEYGTCDDVFYDPRHPYTWALLSSMPDLDTKEKLEAIPGTPPNMIFPPKGDAFAERNKYALEIDYEMEPPLFKVTDTHFAATWLLHPNAPKVTPPKIITERIERMKKADEKHGK